MIFHKLSAVLLFFQVHRSLGTVLFKVEVKELEMIFNRMPWLEP